MKNNIIQKISSLVFLFPLVSQQIVVGLKKQIFRVREQLGNLRTGPNWRKCIRDPKLEALVM